MVGEVAVPSKEGSDGRGAPGGGRGGGGGRGWKAMNSLASLPRGRERGGTEEEEGARDELGHACVVFPSELVLL